MYLDENPSRFFSIKELLTIAAQEAAQKFQLPDLSNDIAVYYRRNHLEKAVLYDDTIPVLRRLKNEGIKMILISDADADILLVQLESFGIVDYFSAMIISSNIHAYKPSNIVVNEALKYCKEPFSEILFVGDNKVDIMTAQKMKINSVLISRDNNFRTAADFKITSLNQIFNIIAGAKNNL